MRFKIKRGLDLDIAGEPEQEIVDGRASRTVALVLADYVGVSPSLSVAEGQQVALGQTLFRDSRNPEVCFTAPGSGVVAAIQRGSRREVRSVVVELQGLDEAHFDLCPREGLGRLSRDAVTARLLDSGLWTALRTRPYGKIPDPRSTPHSLFVTAIDTNPLAADPRVIIARSGEAFADGLAVISRLLEGTVFLCHAPDARILAGNSDRVAAVEFKGRHPAGLVGTHIHFLAPVNSRRTVWHLSYQDVIAIGQLFTTGRISVDRVVSLAGPAVKRPRLLRTRLGASIEDLVQDELEDLECRVISGSVLSGRTAAGWAGFLGRFHHQVSVIGEPRDLKRGRDVYSFHRLWPTRRSHRRALTTSRNGSFQAMIPLGSFERVLPLNLLPTPLCRALLVGDAADAETLGCLELDEEDLALCSFLCPSKIEYGPLLRATLSQLEKSHSVEPVATSDPAAA